MIKKVGTFIAGFVVGIVALTLWGQFFDKEVIIDKSVTIRTDMNTAENQDDNISGISETEQVFKQNNKDTSAETNTVKETQNKSIIVLDQPAGNTVTVQNVILQKSDNGNWIVVHEIKDGTVSNALGATRKDFGTYSGVEVKLLRGTVSGGTYAVVLYDDDGDRKFDLQTDKPLKDAQGKYIMSIFMAK